MAEQNLPSVPEANAVSCFDCDATYLGEDECPEDPANHGYVEMFVTKTPLGLRDDQDYFHYGRKQYEYEVQT